MTDSEKGSLHAVLVSTMRPIAGMLLKFGIGYREFMDASKQAFIEAAAEGFGGEEKPPNISRIALVTGISRKEVRLIRDGTSALEMSATQFTHLPAEVLRQWFTDSRFCDPTGVPRVLTWDEGANSFTDLVRQCGAGLSPVAMRSELLRVGAVKADNHGNLVALRRYFIADSARDRLAEGLLFGIRPMALTVARNVDPRHSSQFRFQRVVDSYSISPEKRGAVEKEVTARLKQYSEELDDLFAEAGDQTASGRGSALGVGLFYFEDST